MRVCAQAGLEYVNPGFHPDGKPSFVVDYSKGEVTLLKAALDEFRRVRPSPACPALPCLAHGSHMARHMFPTWLCTRVMRGLSRAYIFTQGLRYLCMWLPSPVSVTWLPHGPIRGVNGDLIAQQVCAMARPVLPPPKHNFAWASHGRHMATSRV
jgi:hypothetical protein